MITVFCFVSDVPQGGPHTPVSILLVDLDQQRLKGGLPGAWWGSTIGWLHRSPPHFHILYQHLHTSVVTTHTLPVYTESAIQKACQGEGSSTPASEKRSRSR